MARPRKYLTEAERLAAQRRAAAQRQASHRQRVKTTVKVRAHPRAGTRGVRTHRRSTEGYLYVASTRDLLKELNPWLADVPWGRTPFSTEELQRQAEEGALRVSVVGRGPNRRVVVNRPAAFSTTGIAPEEHGEVRLDIPAGMPAWLSPQEAGRRQVRRFGQQREIPLPIVPPNTQTGVRPWNVGAPYGPGGIFGPPRRMRPENPFTRVWERQRQVRLREQRRAERESRRVERRRREAERRALRLGPE